jgi:peptide methionine sulfoxide reductase msrA/msrB
MTFKHLLAGAILIPVLAVFSMTSVDVKASKPRSSVDMNKTMSASKHLDSIVLGAGCFWGAEKRYEAIPGVVDAISGYADGSGVEPNYRAITKYKNKRNPNNHAEVVKVIYNKSTVSLETILQSYFEGHDPTQLNRQGNDIGTQYRSTILTNSDEQMVTAEKVSNRYQALLSAANFGQIVTKTAPVKTFYPAEDYHQDYLAKNPNGYCPDHATGVKFNAPAYVEKMKDNSELLQGKQIVVIESRKYCPFCEKFKANVLNDYKGSIPVSYRFASQLQGLAITTPTWATPTVLFLNDGKEVFGKQGYMKADKFYDVLSQLEGLR